MEKIIDLSTIFQNLDEHLISDKKPSKYLNELDEKGLLIEYPFLMLLALKKTEQSKQYHPEGNVWNHTMLVVDEAAKVKEKSSNQRAFMWAALLHDIGKPDTTINRKGKITSYKHDIEGERKTRMFLENFDQDTEFIEYVAILVRYHMHILFVVKNLEYTNLKGLINDANYKDVALLGKCDRFGRGGFNQKEEEENIKIFLNKCKEYEAKLKNK